MAVESESEYSATLLALYQEAYAKLVKCDPAEFDALYEQLAADFLDAGYQEIIDERLEAYKDGNTTKLPARPAKSSPHHTLPGPERVPVFPSPVRSGNSPFPFVTFCGMISIQAGYL